MWRMTWQASSGRLYLGQFHQVGQAQVGHVDTVGHFPAGHVAKLRVLHHHMMCHISLCLPYSVPYTVCPRRGTSL